jgi:hypothetical protein
MPWRPPQRDRVGDDDLASGDSTMRWIAGPEKTACEAHAHRGAVLMSAFAALVSVPAVSIMSSTMRQSLALHVADEVHDLGDVGALAALVDDREARAQALRVRARALDAAGVGRDEDAESGIAELR